MQQDLQASTKLRQCSDHQLQSAVSRAEKAESELASLQQSSVDTNLQVMKLQAERTKLREDQQCALATAAFRLLELTLAEE